MNKVIWCFVDDTGSIIRASGGDWKAMISNNPIHWVEV